MKKIMITGLIACVFALGVVAAAPANADTAASLHNFHKAAAVKGVVSLASGERTFLVKKGKEKDLGARAPLWIGFPTDLDGENILFGAVITKVSDRESEELGGMKLSAFNVSARVKINPANPTFEKPALEIYYKKAGAPESAPAQLALALPIEETDAANKVAYVDTAPAAQNLDFFGLYDENSRWAGEDGFEVGG